MTQPVFAMADDECGKEFDDANSVGTVIDGATFFTGIVGNYNVLKAGGEAPHANTQGSVELETGQTVFTFSYCPPSGGCDPGYTFLEDSKTKVFQKPGSNGGAVFTIQSMDAGRPTKFTWTVNPDGVISLKNYQYVMPGGAVTTLEHVIKKI